MYHVYIHIQRVYPDKDLNFQPLPPHDDGEMDFLEFIEFFSYMCKMIVKKNPKSKYLKYVHE